LLQAHGFPQEMVAHAHSVYEWLTRIQSYPVAVPRQFKGR
jgi:hypothetical protein